LFWWIPAPTVMCGMEAHCEFLLTSFDSSWGVLENPRHSFTTQHHLQISLPGTKARDNERELVG
ncbi:hypothetical protein L9F63_009939, partial [Diploptera punctata]